MFRFLCVLLCDFHLRRRVCPPVGNVSEQCAWYSNVNRRSGTLDRYIPHRSADSMASCQCSAFCSSRHLLPLCADVCPISAHHVEACPWDHRQDARGNRTLLERTLSLSAWLHLLRAFILQPFLFLGTIDWKSTTCPENPAFFRIRVKNLIRCGIKPYLARIYGNSSKGYWANAEGIMHHVTTNDKLRAAGYPCVMDYYVRMHVR